MTAGTPDHLGLSRVGKGESWTETEMRYVPVFPPARQQEACSFQEVTLKKPPNKVGCVMIEELGDQRVYIKLEIGEGDRYIYGRSFHHDLPEEA